MKNTGIIYSSTEHTPVVLPEMAELLPPLSEEQLGALETDLLKNGCYTSIIVNEDLVVIDGHNRKSLCDKHGLPYQMLVFAFDDLLEAKQWALDTQKGRRNLDKWELGKIALKLKPEIEARAKANMSAGGQAYRPSEEGSATLPNLPPVDTRKELADSVGLGERTMGKVMQIDEHAPAAVKEALDKKELSINQGYQITKQVEDLPEEQREDMVHLLLRHTTTLGVRETRHRRYTLSRSQDTVDSPWGPVARKTSQGWGVRRQKPEFEDLARIAREQDLTLDQVRDGLK